MRTCFKATAAIAATLMGMAAVPAFAQAPMAMPAPPTTAMPYLQMAASGDLYEIQSSQLALQASQDPAVRQAAQMIIADHQLLSRNTMAAARAARVTPPPPALVPEHAQMIQQLQSAGPNFDGLYRQQQIMAHQEALNLHQTYAASGDVRQLRTNAAAAVPVIQKHLQMVQALPAGAAPMDNGPVANTGAPSGFVSQPVVQPTPAGNGGPAYQPSRRRRAGERG